MKQGTTPTLEFKLDIEISNVTEVVFTFTDELKYLGTSLDEEPKYLLQKNYPDDVTFEDDTFKLPLTQEETDLLTNTFFVEAQVICDKAVVKSDIKKVNMPHTLWTTYVDENESDGQSEVIHLSFSDNVIVEGGGSSNYNDLTNKPRINNIELIGNKTDTDLGLATKTELNAKQNTITGGNGIDVSSDVVSVDIYSDGGLKFNDGGRLVIDGTKAGRLLDLRQSLADANANYGLAPYSYVNSQISGRLKRLVVESLPTQDIDTNTIYMILKSVPSTNNIYDEYMYINNAWELIGSTEVDLSNYYTKTETYSKSEVDTALGNKQDTLTASDGIEINEYNEINVRRNQPSGITNYISYYQGGLYIDTYSMGYDVAFRGNLTSDSYQNALQPKLTAGTNITITDNVISASGGSYSGGDGIDITNDTISVDLKSGSKLQFDNGELDVDLSSKEDKTTISTDTTSTTVSLTLADNHEYRYTQDLSSLTLTMPNGDFISSIVFASGSTPTSMTYDSNIKWSGDDITNGQFVPSADKDYDICLYYNGLNVNGIVRGV